jgi:hypothetical protein
MALTRVTGTGGGYREVGFLPPTHQQLVEEEVLSGTWVLLGSPVSIGGGEFVRPAAEFPLLQLPVPPPVYGLGRHFGPPSG